MIEILKDRHKGQRVVLVCNGPSLNDMDLSFLRNEICIGLNKIFLGFQRFHFYPKYYVAVNKKVLEQSVDEIRGLNCVKFLSARCPEFFKANALTHIINTHNPTEKFSYDIAQSLEEGYTVTYAALQIAYYLGFKEVIIIGMDHRFNYSGQPNESQYLKGPDNNHFDQSYFSNRYWDNPDLVNSEKFYTIAKNVFEQSERSIIDASLNGACTIFEKKDYRTIFN